MARLLASLAKGDSIFAGSAKAKLFQLRDKLAPLAARYDVVVANPPYMGGSNMNKWLSQWVKKTYPRVKGDPCTCFIERVLQQLEAGGYTGLATSNSWMFLSSYEKLRKGIIEKHNIATLVQLSVHGFRGIAAQVCTFVLSKEKNAWMKGGYVRLNDFDHHSLQEEKTLEALADPDCGWFYRRDTDVFEVIPGIPIAYWTGKGFLHAFVDGKKLNTYVSIQEGLKTSDNDRFIRYWYEVSIKLTNKMDRSLHAKWVSHSKGGLFRRWYGNQQDVVLYENEGKELKSLKTASTTGEENYGKPCISWNRISSDLTGFRFYPKGSIPNMAGLAMYPRDQELTMALLGLLNSSVITGIQNVTNPTLNYPPGTVASLPIILDTSERAGYLAHQNVKSAKTDWNASETSWDFERHPLV